MTIKIGSEDVPGIVYIMSLLSILVYSVIFVLGSYQECVTSSCPIGLRPTFVRGMLMYECVCASPVNPAD